MDIANHRHSKLSKLEKILKLENISKFSKIFCIRRQEEGGKLTTGDREEVTDIGLGGSCEGSEEDRQHKI